MANDTLKKIRRLLVIGFGLLMLAAGVAMIVLPGPAFIVIPTALALLATEVEWARHLLRYLRHHLEKKPQKDKNSPPPR